ncbi:MAG TPA: preprotein translocase subunit SecE [Smithellaceae bacterium]|jgi:preprotein translocase subunit SecE|nr:preprotein translocase subunit SecE [Syntrophaceae bacterium]MDX9816135.1 preprotein translocase subunit SecE [Smithellaceae bacterium]OPZ52921.1 MAG: preprotein translocase subunit SecE [Deltaproteobacteria bacterium ADurb.BinA014]MBP8608518.1 preprotein translocase subunit SecE [Syntrophaceae bacterium]HNQ17637.1 preprotein translocase subunit SecE [Smithellaceae bacterium]
MEKIKETFQRMTQFFKDAKAELKKVTWPNRKQTLASTSVVLIIVFIVAIYLGIIDYILARLVRLVLG